MIESIINKLFDKRKIENKRRGLTVLRKDRCVNYKPVQNKKTALWIYFASMDGLNVKERGYAVNVSRKRVEYPRSLDFCR